MGNTERKRRRRSREENDKQRERERAIVGHHELLAPPPALLPVASSSSANDNSHRRSALLPFFLLLFRPCHTSTVQVACEQWRALFTQARLSPAHVVRPGSASPCIWAGSNLFQKKIFKNIFQYLWFSHLLIYVFFFCLISVCILCHKNIKSGIKIPGFFHFFKNKNTKKFEKKMLLCIRPSISKLKKSYCVFH